MSSKTNLGLIVSLPIVLMATMLVLAMTQGDETIASFSTSLRGRTPEQLHNIRRAARSLDGITLQPEEVLSFNQTVGDCTSERGYVRAPAIVGGAKGDEVGGGVCQVSSTLYNAALLAGLEIVERHPHSYPVASVPPGRDATVVFGGPDLRVRNSLNKPVRIVANVSPTRFTIRIVGDRGNAPEYRIIVDIEYEVTRLVGDSRPARLRMCTATVWREEVRRGEVISREMISSDVYKIVSGGEGE